MNRELLSFQIEIAIQTSHIEVVYIYNRFHHGLFLAKYEQKNLYRKTGQKIMALLLQTLRLEV